jgi:small subunit ribosomal protein S7
MKKNLVNLNYHINKSLVKNGKLSKINLLMNRVHLSVTKETKKNSFEVLNNAIENIMPIFLLKNKKIGKRIIVSPSFILSNSARRSIGIKWIIEASLKKTGVFHKNLAIEILAAFNQRGSVKKKQKDLNLLILKNKSKLKYRW